MNLLQCLNFAIFRYDVECHWVHYHSNYSDIGAAVASGRKDALSVLGLLMEIDNSNQQENIDWLQVLNKIPGMVLKSGENSKVLSKILRYM